MKFKKYRLVVRTDHSKYNSGVVSEVYKRICETGAQHSYMDYTEYRIIFVFIMNISKERELATLMNKFGNMVVWGSYEYIDTKF